MPRQGAVYRNAKEYYSVLKRKEPSRHEKPRRKLKSQDGATEEMLQLWDKISLSLALQVGGQGCKVQESTA